MYEPPKLVCLSLDSLPPLLLLLLLCYFAEVVSLQPELGANLDSCNWFKAAQTSQRDSPAPE